MRMRMDKNKSQWKQKGLNQKKEPGRDKPGGNPFLTRLRTPLSFYLSLLPSPPLMPHSSRQHKAEAKFNVATECPSSSPLPPVPSPTSF